MTKRIVHRTIKRKRIVSEALSMVRETRESLDPALLEQARDAIGAAMDNYQKSTFRPMQAERVPVDQKKNLTIIMKYLELNPHNKVLQREIRAFLSES